MPAKKRSKKQSKKQTSASKKRPAAKKSSIRKSSSSKKNTTKSSSKKRTVAKRTVTKKAKTKQTKRAVKKIASKQKPATKKPVRKAVSKPIRRTAPVKTKTVTKEIIRESVDDSKFNILLDELRSLRQHNNELSNQIQDIQDQQEQQVVTKQKELINTQQTKGDEGKEELMSKLKEMLSQGKKEDLEDNKELQDKKTTEHLAPESVFNKPLLKTPEAKPHPPIVSEEKKEEFQTTKTRGVLTTEEAKEYSDLLHELIKEINKVFIGQNDVVQSVVLSLICDAHTLLEGVPGLAKSLLIEVFGKTISGTTFERIQFLPDLLPADIIGGQIFNPKTAQFVTHKGPIFANFVLADEINRAPPKTHAAVMEAMQEKKINIENDEFILDRPFLVLATQNPLENKGTYQLPEAVLDRFMFKVILNYPKRSDELTIITDNATTKKNLQRKIKPVMDKQKLLEIQQKVKQVYISDKIRNYILDLVEATRGINKNIQGVKFLKYGAGVRASIYLGLGAKAKALFAGRNYVLPDDVYEVIPDIFRHRLSLNYRGKAHNISTDKIIEEILKKVNAM